MKNPFQNFYFKQFSYGYLGFGIFFYLFSVQPVFILLFLDVILVILLFYGKSQRSLFCSVLAILGSSVAAYLTIRLLQGYQIRFPIGAEWPLGALALFLTCFVTHFAFLHANTPEAIGNEPFKEQKHDLERLQQYIRYFPLLGINAKWGNGKSFLWAHLRESPTIQADFEVLQIDLLTVNLDAIERILVDELEQLLQRYHIHPQSSYRLKAALGQDGWLHWASVLLTGQREGLSASFDALQKDLERLPKRVLLCFEDIDRISDPEQIKKIFAIAEKLSSDRVHFLFQYHLDTLCAKEGINSDYLEKYIPFTVNLSEISFSSLVRSLWVLLGLNDLPFDFKAIPFIDSNEISSNPISQICDVNISISFSLHEQISIRKVKDYLLEFKLLSSSNPEFKSVNNAKTLARVLFIKHFFPDKFQKLKPRKSPLETFLFTDDDLPQTLPSLLKKYHKPRQETKENQQIRHAALNRIFSNPNNNASFIFLTLLGYDFSFYPARPSNPLSPGQKMEEQNSKIDHIIWNVIANACSEWTDAENEIQLLEAHVLNLPQDQQVDAWLQFRQDRYEGNFRKDNRTVEMIGDGPFIGTFRAMQLTNHAKRIQSRWLPLFFKLYVEKYPRRPITFRLFDCLVCCDPYQKHDLIHIFEFFNSLTVTGNPSSSPAYRIFFARYLGAICALGYCERNKYWMFELPLPETTFDPFTHAGWFSQKDAESIAKQALASLDHLYQELTQLRKSTVSPYSLPYVQNDYDVLIAFVKKNQTMLKQDHAMEKEHLKVETKFGPSISINQAEIDRLTQLKDKGADQFEQQVRESYSAGKINLNDLKKILSNNDNK